MSVSAPSFSLSRSTLLVGATVLVLLASTVNAGYLGCPADHEETPEEVASQLALEEYFVGHARLPFFHPIDNFLDDTAGSLGLKSNQFRYILGMFAMFPLALLHRFLPNIPVLKHSYTLACGIFTSLYCFGINTLVPLGTSVLVFVLLKVTFGRDTDKKYVTNKMIPVAYFSLLLAILSGVHIHRLIIDYGGYTLDVSGPQMIITIKLCQVVWNVFDFRNHNPKFPHRNKGAVDVHQLSLLSFLAYIFFFPGYLAGPAFEFQRYLAFTELRDDYSEEHRPSVVSSLPSCFKKIGIALVAMAVTVVLAGQFSPFWMLCDDFDAMPLLQRIAYLHFSVSLLRAKYYVAWSLAEGAIVLCGLGYDSKKKTWDAVDNSKILNIELGQSMRESINNWNINTSIWLRVYVYERAHEAKLGTLAATGLAFMTSAFWHGFYAGYYVLFFFVGIFVQPLAKDLRRQLRPHFEEYKTGRTPAWYNHMGMALTSLALNFYASSFGLLSFEGTMRVWASTYYYGLVGTAAFMLVPRLIKFIPGHKKAVQAHRDAIAARMAAKAELMKKLDHKWQDAADSAVARSRAQSRASPRPASGTPTSAAGTPAATAAPEGKKKE